MSAVERYVRRATRGLWGQKKQDAVTELRGAIEDKIYRHQLCGLSEMEAERAALRDLGSPAAIARELSDVHTGPQVARMTLLLGIAGLLGVQAVAQMATVTSQYLPVENTSRCVLLLATERALLSATRRKAYDALVASQGGPAHFQQTCRTGVYDAPVMLKVADLLAGLRAGGVRVIAPGTPPAAGTLVVLGGANGDIPQASFQTSEIKVDEINRGPYLESSMVIPYLTRVTDAPLHLTGLINPIVSVGTARIQLGTSNAAVQTTVLLRAALVDARRTDSSLPLPVVVKTMPDTALLDPAAPHLGVPGVDGDLYAVVQNILRVNQNGTQPDTLWVQARTDGQIVFTDEVGVHPRIVTTLAALDAATARREKAALVYRLDASDLRQLKLTPVPAAQVKLVPQEQK